MLFRFGEFSVNSSAREVRRGDSLVEIEPRAFELLLYLLEHRDRAVGKDELQDKVWGTIVSDSAMTRSVMKLRKSLNDSNESVIKTVPRFGYRFVAEIEDDSDRAKPTATQSRRKPMVVAAISITLGALLILSFVILQQQDVVDKSVAVLPFDDLSQDQDQQWFADGLAEEILNALSRTPDLAVSSRTSSFTYRDSELDISSIAKQLGVAHVLEGSVRREGDHLRVTAQLIRADDGFHIWSQNFDHSYSDLISIQESVAISIANALQTTMDEELLARFVSSGTSSVPAFEEYLKGISDYDEMIATGDVVTYTSSISRFERAVEIDPDFAQAWYEIARFWSGQMSITGILGGLVDMPSEQMNHRYQEAMDRAIELSDDPAMVLKYRAARAHSAMELKRALRLNTEYLQLRPNDHQARDQHKILLSSLNRYDELVAFVLDVYELDQRDLVSLARSLLELAFSGDREATEAYALKAAEQIGFNAIGLYQLHRAFLWSGNIGRARETYEKLAASEMPASNLLLAKLRQLCAEGKVDAAEKLYGAGLLEHPDNMMVIWVARTIMGEHEAAIDDWRAYDDQDLTQFSDVLQYSMFDPGQYPNLSRFLEEHGEEPGPIRKVPFRCKD